MKMIVLDSTIVCPLCGHAKTEQMVGDECQWYYKCDGCGALLSPEAGDCCIFCSHGDTPCPPAQAIAAGISGTSCEYSGYNARVALAGSIC